MYIRKEKNAELKKVLLCKAFADNLEIMVDHLCSGMLQKEMVFLVERLG